ncbi:MAG: NADH:flavin oxidoreductase/NADH oxidase [Lautropia sp.]
MNATERPPGLFEPLRLRELRLRNRIVLAPMAQYQARDGLANDWHFQQLARYAVAGVALVFTESVKVAADGRSTAADLGLWSDDQIPGLARIASFVRANGAAVGIQLGHAGRKGCCAVPWDGYQPIPRDGTHAGDGSVWPIQAPSAIAHEAGWPEPLAMDRDDIARAIDDFASAAARADAAGFDVLELHGAHGYLLHQFLSPESNRRTDEYGGSAENRARFTIDVVRAVRGRWPDTKPLFFRASVVDEVGWSVPDSIALARQLRSHGVDVIDCSSGGMHGRSSVTRLQAHRPGYQVPFARAVREGAGIATMAVGLIVDPLQADAIIRQGDADLVALGRELLANPGWPVQAARALDPGAGYDLLPTPHRWWLNRRRIDRLSNQSDQQAKES